MAGMFNVSTADTGNLSRGAAVSSANHYQTGMDNAMKQIEAQKAARIAAQDKALDRQIKAMEAMMANPQAAQAIAQAHGIAYTPQLAQILAQPAAAKMAIDGAKMAKSLGITDAQTASTFMGEYINSGGNAQKASEAVQGQNMYKPQQYKPESRYMKVGNDLVDSETMQPVYKGSSGSIDVWDDPTLTPEMRLRAQMLARTPLDDFGGKAGMEQWVKDFEAQRAPAPSPSSSGGEAMPQLNDLLREPPSGSGGGGYPPPPPPPAFATGEPTSIPLPAPRVPSGLDDQTRQKVRDQYGF